MAANTSVAEWLTLAAAIAVAYFAHRLQRRVFKHQLREIARIGLADLTTGEVAAARDCIGTLMYADDGHKRVRPVDIVRSYFVLIWAIERAAASAEALARHRNELEAATQAWAWHLKEIVWNVWLLGLFSDKHSLGLDDQDARGRIAVVLARFPEAVMAPDVVDLTSRRWKFLQGQHTWTPPTQEDAEDWKRRVLDEAGDVVSKQERRLHRRLHRAVRQRQRVRC